MNIKDNIDKISWSFADKALFVGFGFVTLWQIANLAPSEYGVFILVFNISAYLLSISDSMSLHALIQFGADKENRSKLNLIVILIHTSILFGISLLLFLAKDILIYYGLGVTFLKYIYMLPLIALVTIPRTFVLKLLIRDYRFRDVFILNLIFFGVQTGFTVYYILEGFGLNAETMFKIYLSGSFVASLASLVLGYNFISFSKNGSIKLSKVIKFGGSLSAYAAVQSIPKNLDVHIIKIFFPLEFVGIYNSAKTIFRVFEQANDASYGLLYPSSVKLLANNNIEGLRSVITKAISFLFFTYMFLFAILQFGMTELLLSVFGLMDKYGVALDTFNVMVIAVIALPFTLLSVVTLAEGNTRYVLYTVIVSTITSVLAFYLIGTYGKAEYMGLGVVAYHSMLGLLSFLYIQRKYDFKFSQIFRAFNDIKNFVFSTLGKR